MARLPEGDPEPPLKRVQEHPYMTEAGGYISLKTGFVVVRNPSQAAAIRERQAQAIRELAEWGERETGT